MLQEAYTKFTRLKVDALKEELAMLREEEALIKDAGANKIAFLKKILRKIPMGVFIATPDKIIWVNSYLEQIAGYSYSELISWGPEEFRRAFHQEDFTILQKMFADLLNGEESAVGEFRLQSKDGSWHWYHITSSVLMFQHGATIEGIRSELSGHSSDPKILFDSGDEIYLPKILGTLVNIDDRKEVEISLSQSKVQYKKLVSNLPDSILLVKNKEIIYVNKPGADVLGYSEDELLKQPLTLIIPKKFEYMFDDILISQNSKRISMEKEIEIISKSGKRKTVRIRRSIITLEGESVIMSVFTDITGIKTHESLKQYSKDYLISQEEERNKISRELDDNPLQLLNSALSNIKLCESQAEENQLSGIDDIERLLNTAITDIKNISYSMHPRILRNCGLVEAARKLLLELEMRTSIKTSLVNDGFPKLLSDEINIHLYRILQESLNNIEKHSKADSVELNFSCQNGNLLLKIKDNGCSFKMRDDFRFNKEKISFGLRNMKERAGLMNGSLSVRSVPFQGTEIFVSVPYNIV
jgi:PAS domain S-box-containing protein